MCRANFPTFADQRSHVRSDWHGYNLKQKLRGQPLVSEVDFDRLIGDLDESISGSESESSSDEETGGAQLSALLKRQAKIAQGGRKEEDEAATGMPRKKRGAGKAPLIWFKSELFGDNTSLGVYRALFTDEELKQDDKLVDILWKKQLEPQAAKNSMHIQQTDGGVTLPKANAGPNVFLCMIGGGHFAGMIVSLTPKVGKSAKGVEERQAIVIAHKTFHRYTTRRKQGGAQSANDSAKGNANSAGAGIRRHNEVALEMEVRALLAEWKTMIAGCQLLFVRATGTTNRRTLFGPYEGQVLRQNDHRLRTFPFSTRRATQAELMRAFVELTRVKVSEVDEAALAKAAEEEALRKEKQAAKAASSSVKSTTPKLSKEDEEALLHTSQLQALIKRSKVPAILSYLSSNSLSPNFMFHPPNTRANHHASTPLHLAASNNSALVVTALLMKADVDPCVQNGEGKVAFDLAGDKQTRYAFRVARHELGEDKWDWERAHCPPAISRAVADEKEQAERAEADKAEANRRKMETDRLEKEAQVQAAAQSKMKGPGKNLAGLETTAADRREQEARGLTPEMRMKLERERRARAAEERMKRMTGR